ncbi:MAG: cytochrome c family protein [Hyphomicrobium sp.]|jgi:cytochrome c|nr:cytochrome c family protein [Hyphomicrobium sp.]PPD05878.1 MAG: cytochrome c family protein [Hyphomicrobium sp.]
MMKWVIAAGLVLAAPFAASAQDAEAGKAVFKKCAACHQVGPEAKNALGPALTCVAGKTAGTHEGYAGYSDALKKSGIVWDDEKLLAWMEADDKVVPGNKMIFPAGVKDATDRANLLAYIKSQCPG